MEIKKLNDEQVEMTYTKKKVVSKRNLEKQKEILEATLVPINEALTILKKK